MDTKMLISVKKKRQKTKISFGSNASGVLPEEKWRIVSAA